MEIRHQGFAQDGIAEEGSLGDLAHQQLHDNRKLIHLQKQSGPARGTPRAWYAYSLQEPGGRRRPRRFANGLRQMVVRRGVVQLDRLDFSYSAT